MNGPPRIPRILLSAPLAVSLVAFPLSARAQAPVAVVEDVNSKSAGVEFMDYVAPGKVIRLGAADTLVLGYMNSCWQESITGGTVTVGATQSSVAGGKVQREKTACDGGKMQLSEQQASKSGAVVFRSAPKPSAMQPQLTLYGLSPVVDVKGGGHLVIERLDRPGERVETDIAAHQMFRGSFYDFAKAGQALKAGGVYRASVGARQIVFKVDPEAQAGNAPIIGRLLRFPAG
ncbi:MAG TPA: hypothetical protein VMQ11_13730 [Alphaproteobacteria bacterium]|nr:hypothetical protein [Alphaproteobacteria bacterium]